jgi:phenylpyruvate tautomerase PptA (4-oxalocrotonate tautomerase family)
MPLIKVDATERLKDEEKKALCAKLSRICAETMGKPESYVMVALNEGSAILLGGQPGPAAFVDVRGIGGLSGSVNRTLSERICQVLAEVARIPSKRVYLNFASIEAVDWGHDGRTFG